MGAPVVGAPVRAIPGVGVAATGVVRQGRLAVDEVPALAPAVDVGGAGVAVELGGGPEGHQCLLAARHRELGGAARDVEPVSAVRGGGVGPRRVVHVPVVLTARAGRLSDLEAGVGNGGRGGAGPVRGLQLRVLRGVGSERDRTERDDRGGAHEQGGHTHTFHAVVPFVRLS